MSQQKPDLSTLLAETAGSTRKKPPMRVLAGSSARTKSETSPITVHFPKEVRNQLKILAVETNKTMQNLIAEAYNDLFAKYKKPEIAPIERQPAE
jgi:hypothetical protein